MVAAGWAPTVENYLCRVALSEETSPRLHFPNGFDPHSVIFGADRVKEGELYLVRDPLDVLTAA